MSYEYPYMENESAEESIPPVFSRSHTVTSYPSPSLPEFVSTTGTGPLTVSTVGGGPFPSYVPADYLRWLAWKGGKGYLDLNVDLLLALYSDGQEILLTVKKGHGCPRDAVFMGFLLPGQNGWNPGRPDMVRVFFSASSLDGKSPLAITPQFTLEDTEDPGKESS